MFLRYVVHVRITPEKWDEIAAAYINGHGTIEELAERFGVPASAIRVRRGEKRWITRRKRRAENATITSERTAHAIADLTIRLQELIQDPNTEIAEVERMTTAIYRLQSIIDRQQKPHHLDRGQMALVLLHQLSDFLKERDPATANALGEHLEEFMLVYQSRSKS